MISKMTALMAVTDSSSPLICLLCHSNIDLNAFTNVFYTFFPHNGETLSNFVLKILKLTNAELPSSYLCLKCFNSFWLLEQAQSTAANVQSEILTTFQSNNNDKLPSNFLDNTLADTKAIDENFKQATDKLSKEDDSKLNVAEYLTEKDLHSLKSIINQATSDTVISIEIISKPVNQSSVISKDEGSQTVNYDIPNESCIDINSSQASNVPSNLEALNLEDNDPAFPESVGQTEDQSQFEIWQDVTKNSDAGVQCNFTKEEEEFEPFEPEDLDTSTSTSTSTQESPKHSCDTCGQSFDSESDLRAHLLSQHPDLRPYSCEKCGKAYKHKQALEIHLGMHAGFSPFKCPKCGKCFTQKGALQRHLPLHTDEAPFQCEVCGKRFKHHTSYNMHTLSHTGKKAYQCNICNLFLLSTSHLKRHMRVHTGEKPYTCALCGKSFAERYNLQAHQKIHDPEQAAAKEAKKNQHKCVRCTAAFGTKAKYMEHLRTHVGELDREKPKSRFSKSDDDANASVNKSQGLNGVDLLATCVNEVWQSLADEAMV